MIESTELVQRMLAGDERAFTAFFNDYFPRVYRFALPRLNGDADAAAEVPKRPQDRVLMTDLGKSTDAELDLQGKADSKNQRSAVAGQNYSIGHGDVVIAAITSCTNTSNPAVMLGAGLVAKKALEKGLQEIGRAHV